MTIPANPTLEAAPYGAQPVVPVLGPQGGPYTVQGPVQQLILPSAARTTTTSGAVQTNYGYKGILILFSVSANPGGGQTLAFSLAADDANSGLTPALLTVAASTTPGGIFLLYPGLSGAAVEGVTQTRNLVLPSQWHVTVTHSGAGSWTYFVVVHLLP